MNSKEIRYAHIRKIVAAISRELGGAGGITVLAEKLEKSQSQVSQFAGENPTKGIGDKVAPQIEAAFSLPHGALDDRQLCEYSAYRDENGGWRVARIDPVRSVDEEAIDLLRRLTPGEWAYIKEQAEQIIARRMPGAVQAPPPPPAPTGVVNAPGMEAAAAQLDTAASIDRLHQNAEQHVSEGKKIIRKLRQKPAQKKPKERTKENHSDKPSPKRRAP